MARIVHFVFYCTFFMILFLRMGDNRLYYRKLITTFGNAVFVFNLTDTRPSSSVKHKSSFKFFTPPLLISLQRVVFFLSSIYSLNLLTFGFPHTRNTSSGYSISFDLNMKNRVRTSLRSVIILFPTVINLHVTRI